MYSNDLLAQRLGELRRARGWTQVDLAKKCGINYTTINKIESRQRKPTVPVLFLFCKVLNVSSDYLIGLSDNPRRRRY